MSDAPLYERDPAAWQAYLAEGNRTQPRKRVAADVLVRDEVGRILLVHPRYKPDWDLPGGMVEANEPPRDAASREPRAASREPRSVRGAAHPSRARTAARRRLGGAARSMGRPARV